MLRKTELKDNLEGDGDLRAFGDKSRRLCQSAVNKNTCFLHVNVKPGSAPRISALDTFSVVVDASEPETLQLRSSHVRGETPDPCPDPKTPPGKSNNKCFSTL